MGHEPTWLEWVGILAVAAACGASMYFLFLYNDHVAMSVVAGSYQVG